jgi:hypothetical protein
MICWYYVSLGMSASGSGSDDGVAIAVSARLRIFTIIRSHSLI